MSDEHGAMPTEASLTSRLLERLLDQAEAQSKSIQKLEFIVGQLASQVEKVAGRQELACEGIAKHLDDHRTERLAEAREGGRVEGYEEGRAVIPHRVEKAADWLSHDLVKWVYPPLFLLIGLGLAHLNISAAFSWVSR
jgi:flagellar biosynthesis/type III secretory pathway protein FliH